MRLLKAITQAHSLIEIFLEGHNPHSLQKLATADVDALRQKMHSSEGLQAYVVGRMVGAGRGVWAVTDQSVLLCNDAIEGVDRLALKEVQRFEAERGRFGHVVRLHTSARTWSLFGVNRELAAEMHRFIQSQGTPSTFDNRVARARQFQESEPADWAQDCLHDAQMRLKPQ
jgi:hypothetical protein